MHQIPELSHAYEMTLKQGIILDTKQPAQVAPHGWTYGLPPGLKQEQWPLSPRYGFPLRHAFTLKIPEEYRVQSSDLVSLSLFVDDQWEELTEIEELEAIYENLKKGEKISSEGAYSEFVKFYRNSHPQATFMEDILSTFYVGIWLTEEEFNGELCFPPEINFVQNRTAPLWLKNTEEFFEKDKTLFYAIENKEEYRLPKNDQLTSVFPIDLFTREDDPNVGKVPTEWEKDCVKTGYTPIFSKLPGSKELEKFFAKNHIGGTMCPQQGYPPFGPYYIEFEEHFGGFNFGTGNAQLDLQQMKLDWACG